MKAGWHTLAPLLVLGAGCGLFDFTEPTAPGPSAGGTTRVSDGGSSNTPAGGKSGTNGGSESTPDAGAGQSDGGTVQVGTGGSSPTGGRTTTGGVAGTSSGGGGGLTGGSVGLAGASGEPGFDDCGVAAPFPSITTPLDVFDRDGPDLGEDWDTTEVVAELHHTVTLTRGSVTVQESSIANVVEWDKSAFGLAQEVWATIADANKGTGVALWMRDGAVSVLYYSEHQGGSWLSIMYRLDDYPEVVHRTDVRFSSSEDVTFGGRAFPNGCVQLFVNGEMLLHGYLQNGDPQPSEAFWKHDGRIGFAADGPVRIKRFGGGTLTR